MRLSARGAMRTRQDSRQLGGFGQMWKSGEMGRVFYPIFWDEENQVWDIQAAAEWGHNVNPKEISLKRIFIPTLSEIVDGQPKNPDITFQFSRIAPFFNKGAYDKKLAELTSKTMQESARKQAIKKLDEEFEDKEPVVGKLRMVISTECLYVPVNQEGKPDVEKARLVTQDLSDTRINRILGILDNSMYRVEDKTQKWVEVEYTFGTTGTRSTDGNVAPAGITSEYALQHQYPDDWSRIQLMLDGLPDNPETIRKRNSNFRKVEESEILTAISTYSVINSGDLDGVSEEEEMNRLKKNAGIIHNLKIPVENVELTGAIEEWLQEEEEKAEALARMQEESQATADPESEGEPKELSEAPTLSTLEQEHKDAIEQARANEEGYQDDTMTRASQYGVDGSGTEGAVPSLSSFAD